MIILIGLISGLLATMAMDLFALLIARKKIFDLQGLQIVPPLLGRWLINIIKNKKVCYEDLRLLPAQTGERRLGMAAHYVIGIFLGLFFVMALYFLQLSIFNIIFSGIIYGLLTNIFPWLIMYPSLGFGFLCQKLSFSRQLLLFSCLNHLIYGLFLGFITKLLLNPL